MVVKAQPIFQIYRGGVPGPTKNNKTTAREKLTRLTERVSRAGFETIVFHGFARELRDAWEGLSALGAAYGIQTAASWGLDGSTDGGKHFLGAARGDLIGQVLADSGCAFGVLDAEGAYDDSDAGKAGDVTNTANVLAMGQAIRRRAPNALLGTQHWYLLTSHGDIRKQPVPDKPKDVFVGFPQDAFSEFCDFYEFSQAYCNHAETKASHGTKRYEVVFDRMAKDRAKLAPVFEKAGLNWKPGITIQGYGWDDISHKCLDAMLNEVLAGRPLLVWCDWEPSPVVWACAKAVLLLEAEGFLAQGRTAKDVIRAYQTEWNRLAPSDKRLDVDGWGGTETRLTMGL